MMCKNCPTAPQILPHEGVSTMLHFLPNGDQMPVEGPKSSCPVCYSPDFKHVALLLNSKGTS